MRSTCTRGRAGAAATVSGSSWGAWVDRIRKFFVLSGNVSESLKWFQNKLLKTPECHHPAPCPCPTSACLLLRVLPALPHPNPVSSPKVPPRASGPVYALHSISTSPVTILTRMPRGRLGLTRTVRAPHLHQPIFPKSPSDREMMPCTLSPHPCGPHRELPSVSSWPPFPRCPLNLSHSSHPSCGHLVWAPPLSLGLFSLPAPRGLPRTQQRRSSA